MECVEKVFGNVDVLSQIFQHLEFSDQLRLAQVSEQLKSAYDFLSARWDYSSLYVYRWLPTTDKFQSKVVIADKMGVNGKHLTDLQVFCDFFVVHADKVQHLTLNVKCPLGEECFNGFLRAFYNLQSLSTYDMYFSRSNFKNFPVAIQELKLINPCMDAVDVVDLISGYVKNIRKLKIEYFGDFGGKNFIKICRLPKLEILQFKSCFLEGQIEDVSPISNPGRLQELNINLWEMEFFKYLPIENLKVLHLSLNKSTNNIFSILCDVCPNLEKLSLHRVEFAKSITISLPQKLAELNFYECNGLMHTNLKHILTDFRIRKFCSRRTSYEGVFHDFQISSHIQSLEFDFVDMTKFRSAYEDNTYLREFTFNHRHFKCGGRTQDISFNSVLNLETLDVPLIPSLGAISQLKSLRNLILRPFHSPQQNWKITDLLQHPTLDALSIQNVFFSFDNLQSVEVQQKPALTNITRLTITPQILKNLMDYWLELFSINKQMTLICWPIWSERDLGYAHLLVNNEHFPKDLKFMDICCLTIDCADLRKNSEVMSRDYFSSMRLPEEIGINRELSMANNPRMARRYRIILSWKYDYNL